MIVDERMKEVLIVVVHIMKYESLAFELGISDERFEQLVVGNCRVC